MSRKHFGTGGAYGEVGEFPITPDFAMKLGWAADTVLAPNVYRELGAEVISINDMPNGVNINDHCGATHLDSLQTAVMVHEADLGIALDGDADRVMFVEHNGHVVDGDEILFILAQAAHRKGEMSGGVVGTLMSNLGLELALRKMEIPFIRTNVGDRYVVEQLKATGWQLGGEGSGHILSLQYASTGDGIVASLQVLKAILESQKSLSEIKAGMIKLPQVLINVRLVTADADSILATSSVQQAVIKAEGILGDQGRVLLRKSGTEPLIRVMVESTDNIMTQTQAKYIADAVRTA